MKTINTERVPLYVFTNPDNLEEDCLQQARNMSNLLPAYHHTALMPDAHIGYGMPIGGVLALEGAVCPNAVGMDIGCGMAYVPTNLPASAAAEDKLSHFTGQVMRNVPMGFRIHDQPQSGSGFIDESLLPPKLKGEVPRARKSLGTLGGGNHFVDVLKTEEDKVSLMVHTGSRHFGYAIAEHFHEEAQKQCHQRGVDLPDEDLAYLDLETETAQSYIQAMQLAMRFARENRHRILETAKRILVEIFGKLEFGEHLNAHHNYAASETHFGKEVWVHRKGAIRAREGDVVIVPGSLGTNSYIGKGLGNPASFKSCAHGAGRTMGRNEAKRKFTVQEVMEDIKKRGIVLGKAKKSDVPEESPWAYKDIENVIEDQEDLAVMEVTLSPLAVVIA
ncbi:MAG: RtcB family protein [Patescibacteria group bacterium]